MRCLTPQQRDVSGQPETFQLNAAEIREKFMVHPRGRTGGPAARSLVSLAVACVLGAAASSTMAQVAPASSQNDDSLQEVVVTGTMIKRTDAETAEAITILKADDIKQQGITSTEQLVQQIMSNQSSSSYNTASTVSTWTGGGSFASLRGLGSSRTLVLLDGQRLADNVVLGAGVDLDTIPASAIDHVEVLREGASALYGSDAIAGVINIVTKKNYDQGEITLNLDHPQHDGGGNGDVDFTFGKGNLASDGYNFMITASYKKQQELVATQRSFSATGYDATRGLNNTNGYEGPFPGAFEDNNGGWYQTGSPTACTGNPYPLTSSGYCGYGYSSAVDLIPQSQMFSGLASFTKALAGNNTLSIQYYWGRSDVTAWGGPMEYTGYVTTSSPYYPSASNATYILGTGGSGGTADISGDVWAGFTDPNNNRFNSTTNTEQRALITFSGENGGWNYEVNLDYSQNNNVQNVTGYPNLDVIEPDYVFSDLINPFGAQSAAGQALIDSAYENGELAQGLLKFESFNGHAGHALGDLFHAGRPLQVAFGFDAHGEQISYHTTQLAEDLQTATYFPPTQVSGSQNDMAGYVELNVPVTQSLEFTLSDREDHYSDFGGTNNYKLSFRWQPFDMLTFRGAASTGFRAPSLVDLFSPQTFGATSGYMTGPAADCAATTGAFANGNCSLQGVAVSGGNPDLKPEKSENFDFGFVIEPFKNLGITVDYYRINLKNAIGTVPAATIYANPTAFADDYVLNSAGTLTAANSASQACTSGETTSGSVLLLPASCGYIKELEQNSGGIFTDGFDLSARYQLRTYLGNFSAGYESTFVTQYREQSYSGGAWVNRVGWYDDGYEPILRYQHTLNLDWTYGKVGAGLSNTFQSRYIDEWTWADGNYHNVAAYSLVNGYVTVHPVDELTVTFGIRNIFDRNPSFSNQTGDWQSGYNSALADPLGRNFYLQLKYDFDFFSSKH